MVDLLSSKMQALAVAGMEADVVAACSLIKETSFSTILVEQAHASGAQLMHRHHQLETASLVCRMTVHNCRTLFDPSPFEKQEQRLLSLLDDVQRQVANTRHTGPRQAYVQMLVSRVKAIDSLGIHQIMLFVVLS